MTTTPALFGTPDSISAAANQCRAGRQQSLIPWSSSVLGSPGYFFSRSKVCAPVQSTRTKQELAQLAT